MLFLLAVFPICLALVLMTKFHVKPGIALPGAWICTALAGMFAWRMPLKEIAAVSVLGVFKSLDIILIVYCAVLLLNILRENKAFDVINSTFGTMSSDRRIQLVIIAWFFSSFIEGAAGFGSAPALAAPLLAGLGFPVVIACAAALVGNTFPVPFGAVGTPTITLNAILSKNLTDLGIAPQAFANELMLCFSDISLLSGVFMPFVMVAFMIFLSEGKNKLRAVLEIFPFCMLSGIVYFVPWKLTAVYLGPELPSMTGAVCAFPVMLVVLKFKPAFFVPEKVWDFGSGSLQNEMPSFSKKEQFKAWLPYLLIAFLLILTRLPMLPFKGWLTGCAFAFPEILGVKGTAYSWALLYNPGVFPFLAVSFAALFIFGIRKQNISGYFISSGKQVMQAAAAIAASFAIVQIMVFSNGGSSGIPGMLTVIASTASAYLGKAYFLAAPVIGVMGTFFAGSCTVSNILFGSIQFNTAHIAGLSEEIVTALQNVGGGIGSMIRISGVVATCATVGAAGKEGKIILLNCIPCAVMILLALAAAFFILL